MMEYRYNELKVGHKESFIAKVDQDKMDAFMKITGDENPLHIDSKYAKSKEFPDKAVYGMLTASFFSTLAGMYLPGKYSLIHSVEVKFPNPLFLMDSKELRISGEIVEKNDLFKLLTLKVEVKNDQGIKVCRGKMKVGVLDE